MLTSEFEYTLPEESIAQIPAPRGESRLLRLDGEGRPSHHRVADLPALLRPGDLLVVNDTKVIPARLEARRRQSGGRMELLLVEKLSATEWTALAKPGKRARPGSGFDLDAKLGFQVLDKLHDGKVRVRFTEPIDPQLDRLGHVPLPPYIRRGDRPADRTDYQTVFATRPGAIAAPTAGLHFTEALLQEIGDAGIRLAAITLHVGIGTFKPVTATRVEDHRMDVERFEIPPETATAIAATRAGGGRIVAVGTTVVRTLESVATQDGRIEPTTGETNLYIRPGYRFRAVDLVLTNFHLPRSTLLMLVCAFAGRQQVLAAYREAINSGYRFYSYGDCMLAAKAGTTPASTG